jgi:hypothetical protein
MQAVASLDFGHNRYFRKEDLVGADPLDARRKDPGYARALQQYLSIVVGRARAVRARRHRVVKLPEGPAAPTKPSTKAAS